MLPCALVHFGTLGSCAVPVTVRQSRVIDQTLGSSFAFRTGVPSYQVEDEEGRIHLLINLPIDEEDEDRWCLWRPDQAGFDSRSIFDGALAEE